MNKSTDWTNYYKTPSKLAQITRKITIRKVLSTLHPYISNDQITVCEIGGANSCIANSICKKFNISNYHVSDTNEFGLSLLKNLSIQSNLTSKCYNVLEEPNYLSNKFDVVISIGLIEHFNVEGTKSAILNHFSHCKPNGLVLITFPTPTPPYKLIRGIIESCNAWSFPDERPLHFDEVLTIAHEQGEILHTSINWAIGLTQAFVLVRKQGKLL